MPAKNSLGAESVVHAKSYGVLHVMGGLDPSVGGPPTSGMNIWLSALTSGIKIVVAASVSRPPTEGEKALLDNLHDQGLEVYAFPVSFRWKKFVHWGGSLRLIVFVLRSSKRFDILNAHGPWMISSIVSLFVAKARGRKFALIPHESLTESDVVKGLNPLKHLVKRVIKMLYLRFTDMMILASQIEQRDSTDAESLSRSCVIYHPIVKSSDPPAVPRRGPRKSGELHVGFLGRFDPKKNLELVLQAVSEVPAAVLHVAGDGPKAYRNRLKALAESLDLEGRIQWLGFISVGQKPAFFASIDVLAMPSNYECFGMVAAEAMLHGVPVIASNSTGIAEVMARHDCGVVIPPSAVALASVLRDLVRDPARLSDFSRLSIAACYSDLSFELYGRSLKAIYDRLME